MKKLLIIQAIIAFVSVMAFAENPFDEFKNQITGPTDIVQAKLDNLSQDIGFLLGGGAFHQGKALGFPGFDVGVRMVAKNTNKDDSIIMRLVLTELVCP